jgi:hypothetical protein
MCDFFSFVTRGDSKPVFFSAADRAALRENNPEYYNADSHTSIIHNYISENAADEDECNKYEYTRGVFTIDQINTTDDSKQVRSWIEDFSKSEEFKNICLEAVKQNGCALKYVPENLKTKELCLEAVKQDGYALKYVPENLKEYVKNNI